VPPVTTHSYYSANLLTDIVHVTNFYVVLLYSIVIMPFIMLTICQCFRLVRVCQRKETAQKKMTMRLSAVFARTAVT